MISNAFYILSLMWLLSWDDHLERGNADEEILDALEEWGDEFEAKMGAEAVMDLLSR